MIDREVIHSLRAEVQQVLEKSGPVGIQRVSRKIQGVFPLEWLMYRPRGGRIYWSGRDYGIEMAAFGEADCQYSSTASGIEALRGRLKGMLAGCRYGVRYYGGIRFDLHRQSEKQWNPFGDWRFVLPRFEIRSNARGTILLCNLVLPRDSEQINTVLAEIDEIQEASTITNLSFTPLRHRFCPDFEEWDKIVGNALDEFRRTSLEKVVLAREARVEFSESIEPISVIQRLKKVTPNCFHFLFEPVPGETFLGASPERLFRREGRSIESEAVAGTRPSGKSQTFDERMIKELCHSAKENREHEFVRISLQEEMASLAAHITMDPVPSIMSLASEIHLVSRLRAILQPEYTSLDILETLHPSPAVGGYPSDHALDLIRQQEPFDRGWYAGPVGWIGVNEAEFAVGIRSSLVSGSMMRLYSGAGIVRGSTSLDEWGEIGYKIGDMAHVVDWRQEDLE